MGSNKEEERVLGWAGTRGWIIGRIVIMGGSKCMDFAGFGFISS